MIDMVAKLLAVLNSETEPGQISLGFCLAMIMGFTPLFSFHNLFILLFVLVIRANLSAFLLGWGIFSAIAYLLDPLFHSVGYQILTMQSLNGLWTSFYNITLLRLENFNNSIVMGSLLISLILFIPFYFISNLLIRKYRERFLKWIQKTKIVEIMKASKLFSAYQALTN
jgi:uncharacterized protein (TIGR03546 family)